MKKTLFIFFSVVLFGCSSNEPQLNDPIPVADFSYAPTTIREGQSIKFTNESTDAYSYKWDFGNNSTSTAENPSQTFTQGTWTVTLTATNAQSKKDVISKTINVLASYKSVTITKYTVNKISFVTSSGSGWDSSTGPDIFLYFSDNTTSSKFYETDYFTDIKPTDIPYYVNITIPFTNLSKTYSILMYDYDPIDSNDYMAGFSFDIPSLIPSYPSTITLSSGNYEIVFTLQWNS